MYQQSIEAAYDDARNLINAHALEIKQDMESGGVPYMKEMVDALVEESDDKNLYLGLKKSKLQVGNFEDWDAIQPLETKPDEMFHEIPSGTVDGILTPHLLAKVLHYPKNVTLVIGYDLRQIDSLKYSLHIILAKNIVLSFVISIILSILIMWLLNRHLRKFNVACNAVMGGDLKYRIKTDGGSDQFDRLAQNLNEMLDWNATLLSTVADSSNAIAHDMRTPISRLRLRLSRLSEKDGLDKDMKRQLRSNISLLDRMVVMFDNILNIAKAEARASTELFEELDMCQLTQNVFDFYESIIEDKNIKPTLQLPRAAIMFIGDKQLLSQALVNLLDNACKYTPEGGQIAVSLIQKDAAIIITVTDSGGGIPDDLLERAKDRFFRVDASRNTHGHGLGLSLVNAVAKLHKGQLILNNIETGLEAKLILNNNKNL